MDKFFTGLIRNGVFANILLSIIFAGGAIAATSMVREVFPYFSLDMILVRVIWPGADPSEVEEGISRKIEEAIESVEGIKQYNSISSENYALVQIEVAKGHKTSDVLDRVRNEVDAISTFPQDAEKPTTEELILRSEVCYIALYGDGMSEKLLKEWGETLRDEIQQLPDVSQVQLLGAREYEIGIELSEERLREYGLSFEQVSNIVRASNLNLSGGTMRTQGEEIRLRTLGRKYTGAELAKIVVAAGPRGEIITLDRVANIKDEFTEDRIVSKFNGHPSINIAILKTPEEDALKIAAQVKDYVAVRSQQLPDGIELSIWGDTSKLLSARISLLVRNGVVGLVMVFVLLWLFLDIRLSFWAGMGMPISIAGALAIMYLIGATLNMISLFGLIMVLGIIVDDAIVVGDAIYHARHRGNGPLRAAVSGTLEVGMPVIAAVTTTIIAFVPLLYVDGIFGKFIAILPVVVISCLVISLVECLLLLPAHLNHLPDPKRERKQTKNPIVWLIRDTHHFMNRGLDGFVERYYHPFIRRVLKWRYAAIAVGLAVCLATFGLIGGGFLKFFMFPRVDSDLVTAVIEFPNGTPLSVTQDGVTRLEEALKRVAEKTQTVSGEPLIIHEFSLAGQTIDDDRPRTGNNLGAVRAEFLPTERRGVLATDIMVAWEKEVGIIPGVEGLSFSGIQAGPPGAPIEIWVQGADRVTTETLQKAADEVKDKLASYEGVYQIQHDLRPGKKEIQFKLKPEARTLGVTVADLATQVNAGYFGEEAVRLQRGRDDVRVRVRYDNDARSSIAELDKIRIRTRKGEEVPLRTIADITFAPGFADIKRTDGMRRASVTAEIDDNVANPSEIFADLNNGFFQKIENEYPGVTVAQQGEIKKMNESLGPLATTYPLALLGIFIIIATTFRSYLQPIIIMFAIPFGIVGALLSHFLLGWDLSIMSVFGIVALSGVVVNDSIVLIECVNDYLAEGRGFYESLRMGGARRFRAIILTTVTTVGGLVPLILEPDMQAQFLVPMAIALSGGVAFSTLLTLILVPCMMAVLNDCRLLAHWMRTGEWVLPELLEPARYRRVDPDQLEEHPELVPELHPANSKFEAQY
ncbi:MAG: AcrB/AcrD/AcrF family protein [Candidatus Hydrogenedens sp.]|nr:AcrB/AcrD/AcrF family protein [Candidatus Hydrogenedens sp.]